MPSRCSIRMTVPRHRSINFFSAGPSSSIARMISLPWTYSTSVSKNAPDVLIFRTIPVRRPTLARRVIKMRSSRRFSIASRFNPIADTVTPPPIFLTRQAYDNAIAGLGRVHARFFACCARVTSPFLAESDTGGSTVGSGTVNVRLALSIFRI